MRPDFKKMAIDAVSLTVGKAEYIRRDDAVSMANAAYGDGMSRAAHICRMRYMGDNSKVDMEARRCAEAILLEKELGDK